MADPPGANSPFSLTFTIQQSLFPQGTEVLLREAFGNASQFGHTISFFWDWAYDDQLPALIADVKLAQALGFKTVVNMTVNDVPLMDAPPGFAATFASAATSMKYIQDVGLLASINPTYLNIYPEVNLLARYDAPEFANYRKVYPTAYAVAKAASPTTLVGVSMLDVVWQGNHQQALPDQLGAHDFIGVTTYPFSQFATPSDLPPRWYSQWRDVYPTSKILFTEVGWGSAAPLSERDQAQYLAALPAMMAEASPDVIAWSLQYDGAWYDTADLKPNQWQFFHDVEADPHFLYAQFNHDGLFNDDGSPKPSFYVAKSLTFSSSPTPPDAIRFTNAVTGASSQDTGTAYTGPVDYLQRQYIWPGTDAVAIAVATPNTFVKGGPSDDAIFVTAGSNVLDGGGGSNYLTGADGTDGGFDTFFVDSRGSVETWSTVVNFHQGDQATIFGFRPGLSTMPLTDNEGAPGATGLTLHSEINGPGTGILASITFAGHTQAAAAAHFSVTTGTLLPGTPGAIDYLLIQYDR